MRLKPEPVREDTIGSIWTNERRHPGGCLSKSRCPACKRPAHIAKRDETFYFVDDEYNPFVRHAPVKTTEAVFRFFANGYRREHGTEPEVTGNRKLSERDILSGMGAVPTKTDLGKR